jgi:hypothetical protein
MIYKFLRIVSIIFILVVLPAYIYYVYAGYYDDDLEVYPDYGSDYNVKEKSYRSFDNPIRAFRFYKNLGNFPITVPTVIEVPLDKDDIHRFNFAVLDLYTNTFEPYFFKNETFENEIPFSLNVADGNYNGNLKYLYDNNYLTYVDFPITSSEQAKVRIVLNSQSPITSSRLNVYLDTNVELPETIEIRALVDNEERIIVAEKRMYQQSIDFLKTTSNKWIITFKFSQPLRISELKLVQDNATKITNRSIRFLAQPKHQYYLYLDPDRPVDIFTKEGGDLESAKNVFVLSSVPLSIKNPSYVPSDIDDDGIIDINDNCPSVYNKDQQDINKNGIGDACEDFDNDGIINVYDNCPNNPNRNQEDTDGDKIGDVCDPEESRLTEKYPWIPWIGIIFAGAVVIILFILTAKASIINNQDNNQN